MADWERDYRLPATLGFSFEGFLAEQGERLLEALAHPGAPPAPKLFQDHSLQVVLRLEGLAGRLAEALGVTGAAFTRTSTVTRGVEEGGWLSMPTERLEVRYQTEQACWTVIRDRLENGHLGCFEDDVCASFESPGKSVQVRCYIFKDDELSLKAQGVSEAEWAAVQAVVVRALRLEE